MRVGDEQNHWAAGRSSFMTEAKGKQTSMGSKRIWKVGLLADRIAQKPSRHQNTGGKRSDVSENIKDLVGRSRNWRPELRQQESEVNQSQSPEEASVKQDDTWGEYKASPEQRGHTKAHGERGGHSQCSMQ